MVTLDVPAVLSTVPLASVRNTLRTQVEVLPAGTGSGGPKMQRGSGLHSPVPPQSSSVVHAVSSRVQLLLAYGPKEQSTPMRCPPQPLPLPPFTPLPSWPTRLSVLPPAPEQLPTPNTVSGPSGLALGGVEVLLAPPT